MQLFPVHPKSLFKKFTFFSSNLGMSGQNVNFGDKKKSKKVTFTKATKWPR